MEFCWGFLKHDQKERDQLTTTNCSNQMFAVIKDCISPQDNPHNKPQLNRSKIVKKNHRKREELREKTNKSKTQLKQTRHMI